jgi:hypothetical protein
LRGLHLLPDWISVYSTTLVRILPRRCGTPLVHQPFGNLVPSDDLSHRFFFGLAPLSQSRNASRLSTDSFRLSYPSTGSPPIYGHLNHLSSVTNLVGHDKVSIPLLPVSTFPSLPALYTKLLAGKCLIDIAERRQEKH